MTVQPILDQIVAVALQRANALLLARAVSELPAVTAALDAGGVRLSGHRLHERMFGSRHRRRDPRVALVVRGSR